MFDTKQQSLFPKTKKTPAKVESLGKQNLNQFEKGALFAQDSNKTTSENGSLKFSTTGSNLVDQFAKAGSYLKPRSFSDISKDMEKLWNEDRNSALRFTFYLRAISGSRKNDQGKDLTEEKVLGQGLKNESIKRMMWVAVNYPEVFANNIKLFIAIGSWKDIFQMMRIDLVANGWDKRILNWDMMKLLIMEGLDNPNQAQLIKKYLPTIASKSRCTTVEKQANHIIGSWISSFIFGEKDKSYYKKYRQLKSSGVAHQWQQLISQGKYQDIDFNSIHGKALRILVKSKFLTKTNLQQKYNNWISKADKAKVTDYLFELFKGVDGSNDKNLLQTVDKQFLSFVEKANEGEAVRSLIPVLDSSGSMGSQVTIGVSAWDVARSMGLYCSYQLKNKFNMSYFEFSDGTLFKQWKGTTPTTQFKNANNSRIVGGTNFASVFDKLIKIKQSGVNETDFPTGIICFSDGEFNGYGSNNQSIVQSGINKLKKYFSEEYCNNFIVILWDIQRGQKKVYEGAASQNNLIQIGGYDPSILNLILRGANVSNSNDMVNEALNQPYLDLITV